MGEIVPYGEHPLQALKYFRHDPSYKHTLVLIHGGAWRDPNNTFDDFQELVLLLNKLPETDGTNIVGVNYRLSPQFKHPAHIQDVVLALQKVVVDTGSNSVSIVGHSVGATLMLQLLNYSEMTGSTQHLDLGIRSLYFLDGIYDVPDLVDEYGAPYKEFVDLAFSESQVRESTQMTWGREIPLQLLAQNYIVVQSNQDELLSGRQTARFLAFLTNRGVQPHHFEGDWGAHEEVYKRAEVADIIRQYM